MLKNQFDGQSVKITCEKCMTGRSMANVIWRIQKGRRVIRLFSPSVVVCSAAALLFWILCPVPSSSSVAWFDLLVRFTSTVFRIVLTLPFPPSHRLVLRSSPRTYRRTATETLQTICRAKGNVDEKILPRWGGAVRVRRKGVRTRMGIPRRQRGREREVSRRSRREILITMCSAQWL